MTDNLREQMPNFIKVGLIIPGFVASGLTAQAPARMDTDQFCWHCLRDRRGRVLHCLSCLPCTLPTVIEIEAAYNAHALATGDEEYGAVFDLRCSPDESGADPRLLKKLSTNSKQQTTAPTCNRNAQLRNHRMGAIFAMSSSLNWGTELQRLQTTIFDVHQL